MNIIENHVFSSCYFSVSQKDKKSRQERIRGKIVYLWLRKKKKDIHAAKKIQMVLLHVVYIAVVERQVQLKPFKVFQVKWLLLST